MEAGSYREAPRPNASNFKEMVVESQNRWRGEKKNFLVQASQQHEFPPRLTEKLYKVALDNLPDYIPAEVKASLGETHPTPIVTAGLTADKRLFGDPYFKHEAVYPEGFNPRERNSWNRGVEMLEEMGVELLASDIIDGLRSKNKTARLLARNTTWVFRTMIHQVKGMLGNNNEQFEQFRKALITSLLSDDSANKAELNNIVRQAGYVDIDRFAVAIGGVKKYAGRGVDTRRDLSLMAAGVADARRPGIVNIHLGPAYGLTTGFAFMESFLEGFAHLSTPVLAPIVVAGAITRDSSRFPKTVLHEIGHYWSQGAKHKGLSSITYSS